MAVYFEITDKKEIERLGFVYEPDEERCIGHIFNDLPFSLDMRNHWDLLDNIEAGVDRAFETILVHELKDSGITKLNRLSWERIFFFPYMNPRQFEARYWIRVVGMEAESGDSHVRRV